MPLYEFKCKSCDHIFEELCRMGATGEGMSCPTCGDGEVHKLMSTFSGRVSSGNGQSHSVAGSSCSCGGDCSTCSDCTCH